MRSANATSVLCSHPNLENLISVVFEEQNKHECCSCDVIPSWKTETYFFPENRFRGKEKTKTEKNRSALIAFLASIKNVTKTAEWKSDWVGAFCGRSYKTHFGEKLLGHRQTTLWLFLRWPVRLLSSISKN